MKVVSSRRRFTREAHQRLRALAAYRLKRWDNVPTKRQVKAKEERQVG